MPDPRGQFADCRPATPATPQASGPRPADHRSDAVFWDCVVDASTRSYAAGYDHGATVGYAQGHRDGQRDALQHQANQAAAAAMVKNYDVARARARSVGR